MSFSNLAMKSVKLGDRRTVSDWKSPVKMSLTRSFSQVLLAMTFYVAVGTLLTFYNKTILSKAGFNFEMTMILYQSVCNSIFAAIYCYIFLRDSAAATTGPFWPTNVTFSMFFAQLFPVGALFGFDITLTNLAFRLSSVALTEVVKSGVPALVLGFGILVRTETMTRQKLVVILVLCAGIIMTTGGEFSVRFSAILAAAGATFCGAAKLVLMQRLLVAREHTHPTLSLMYLSASSAIALTVPFALYEASDLLRSSWVAPARLMGTLVMLMLGSVLAFLLNMSELVVIQWTSALSLCVAGVVKLLVTIVISALWYDFHPTRTNICGSLLAVAGVIAFNCMTYNDRRRALQYAKLDADLDEFNSLELSPITLPDTVRQ